MKKLMLIAGLFAATASFAQPSIGVHGNVIGASMTNKSDEASEEEFGDFKTRISWKLGLVAEIPVSDQFVFAPQLNLLSKGGKIDQTGTIDFGGEPVDYKLTGNAKLTYLELPLNFAFKSSNGFFFGAGPVISYGLGGEVSGKATASFMGQTASEPFNGDVIFDGKKAEDVEDEEEVHFKALDFGANIFLGYQLPSGISVNLHYNHSFSNIDPNEGSESKNKYFGLGITYFFNRK